MARNLLAISVSVFGLLLAASSLSAHHSAWVQFDLDDPVEVEGVVSKVEWQNPHVWFYVDVTDENGDVTTWGFGISPPGRLIRRGIVREHLQVGDLVKVDGFRARDGSPNASGRNVTFADGREVFAGAAEEQRRPPNR